MHLGIDLGTSNSAIVGNHGADLKVFKTAEGTDVLPSAIYIDKRGHKFIGARAADKAMLSPENAAQGFKRLMGTSSPIEFSAAGIEMSPEECSADIIRTLLAQAATESGSSDNEGTIVSVPAAFNQMQSEMTIRAAKSAGLERVGLLQEPIAAALASIAKSTNKNGLFLVYDMGGGTFDVALVQSVSGAVDIVAHEGINMLGGRDFDRRLVDEFVYPWLQDTFVLPRNFSAEHRYKRLLAMARHAAEKAKIALSSSPNAIIFAGDEEIRVTDEDGEDLYLDIEVTRDDMERLVRDLLDETVNLCRKTIKDNGFSHEDVDRIVLIGGPSKMPCIRERVPGELGISADLETDPMTAVAFGAAIQAEGREWSTGPSKPKSGRGMESHGGIDSRYVFPARVSVGSASVRVKPGVAVDGKTYRLQIDTTQGWTSGLVDVRDGLTVEIPVANLGENRFRITVYDLSGTPVAEEAKEIVIFRSHASAPGIRASKTLSVKVVDTRTGRKTNALEPLVSKGTLLPVNDKTSLRVVKDSRSWHLGQIHVEIFEQAEGVPEPELALFVGAFRINARAHLGGERLRAGEEIVFHWELDDNALLKCKVGIPSLHLLLDEQNFYVASAGHQNFEGKDGEKLVEGMLAEAEKDVAALSRALGHKVSADAEQLEHRLKQQRKILSRSSDADSRRAVAEEARRVRQEISRLKHAPENRKDALGHDLDNFRRWFDRDAKEYTEAAVVKQFDRLSDTARKALDRGDLERAERAREEMRAIWSAGAWKNPAVLIRWCKERGNDKHRSVDKKLHDELVSESKAAISENDLNKIRDVLKRMRRNMFPTGGSDTDLMAPADVGRA